MCSTTKVSVRSSMRPPSPSMTTTSSSRSDSPNAICRPANTLRSKDCAAKAGRAQPAIEGVDGRDQAHRRGGTGREVPAEKDPPTDPVEDPVHHLDREYGRHGGGDDEPEADQHMGHRGTVPTSVAGYPG